jgi:hypothetical protein
MKWLRESSTIERCAWLFWLAMLVYLSFFAGFNTRLLASTDYYHAAQQWLTQQSIYDGQGWSFIYFPQSAVLYLPFGIFSPKISDILWRVFLVVLLSSSFWQLKKIAPFPTKWFFFVLTVIGGLIIASGAFKLGQMNIVVAALMLFTVVAIARERWWLAALTLTLVLAFKPTSIIFWLLLGVLYQPLRLKMVILFIAMMALPFLFAKPDYVMSQYSACVHTFQIMSQTTSIAGWADFFNMLNMFTGWQLSAKAMFGVRIVLALAVLALGYYCRRKYSLPKYSTMWSIILVYSVAASYLLLFNPRTENNGYIILAPMLVWFAFYFYHQKTQFVPLLVYLIVMCVNYSLCQALNIPNTWLRPLATCLFTGQLLWWLYRPYFQLRPSQPQC